MRKILLANRTIRLNWLLYRKDLFCDRRGQNLVYSTLLLSARKLILQELAPCFVHASFVLACIKLVAGFHRASPSTTPDKSIYSTHYAESNISLIPCQYNSLQVFIVFCTYSYTELIYSQNCKIFHK